MEDNKKVYFVSNYLLLLSLFSVTLFAHHIVCGTVCLSVSGLTSGTISPSSLQQLTSVNEGAGSGGHPELSTSGSRGSGVSANGFNSNPFGGASTTGSAGHYLRDWSTNTSIYDGPNSANYTITVGDHRRMSPDRAAGAAATAAAVGISAHQLGIH